MIMIIPVMLISGAFLWLDTITITLLSLLQPEWLLFSNTISHTQYYFEKNKDTSNNRKIMTITTTIIIFRKQSSYSYINHFDSWIHSNTTDHSRHLGVSMNGGTPIARWFISSKIRSINGWFGGTSI